MAIVVSDRQRIHYQFEGERGAFVILHHGLFGALQDWIDTGYAAALATDFRVILLDARGHGRSDRPTDPGEYRLPAMAGDVVAILDELDIRNAHFIGYSLGALVGFELLRHHPERVRLIMLGGEAPMVTQAGCDEWRRLAGAMRQGAYPEVLRTEREAERLIGDAPALDEGGGEAALALLDGMAGWEVPDTEQVQVRSPITVYCGGDDPALARAHDGARAVQRARFIPFGGYSHRRLFQERETLLEAILRFVRISRRAGEGPSSGERGGGRSPRQEPAASGGGEPAPTAAPAPAPETPDYTPVVPPAQDTEPPGTAAEPPSGSAAPEDAAKPPSGSAAPKDAVPPATGQGPSAGSDVGAPAGAADRGTMAASQDAFAGAEEPAAPEAAPPPASAAAQPPGQGERSRRNRRGSGGRDRRRGRGRRGKRDASDGAAPPQPSGDKPSGPDRSGD